MATFNILLSTYNGEKYLKTQLDSLLTQTFQDFLIVIRDDGSTDRTMDIIDEYKAEFPEKIITLTSYSNLGYPDCFWELLERTPEAKYYAFCDQDDVWYEDKLAMAYEMLEKGTKDEPKIYYHAYDINYDDGPKVDTYYPGNIAIIPIEKQFFYCYTMGYTIVLNQATRELLLEQEPKGKDLPHDVWTLFNVYYRGYMCYDDKPKACYRRHSNSVTSSGKGYSNLITSWITKEILGGECVRTRNRVSMFFEKCADIIPAEDKKKFMLFGYKKGFKGYFKKLFYPHRLKDSWGGELATRILFLLNR